MKLGVNALNYLTGSWEGFWMLASACVLHVRSECTALLSQRLGYRGVSDSGFSSCAAPTYYCGSEYFLNCCPQIWNLIGTEHSLNRSERRVKNKAS